MSVNTPMEIPSYIKMIRQFYRGCQKVSEHQKLLKKRLSTSSLALNKHKYKIDEEAVYQENWKLRCELATTYRAFEK